MIPDDVQRKDMLFGPDFWSRAGPAHHVIVRVRGEAQGYPFLVPVRECKDTAYSTAREIGPLPP